MNEHIAADELLYLPASEGSLPHITPAMILDCLSNFRVISKPSQARRVFRWFISVPAESTACSVPANMPDASLLFACSSRNALAFLEERPAAFALVCYEGECDTIPEEYVPHRERCIIVGSASRISYLTLLLQSCFIKILLWENDLKNISLRGGDLTDMLNASTPVLKNFIFASDNNFSVIGRTTNVEPPDELHRTIIENGCLTPTTIAEKRFRLPEKTFYTRAASEITPFDRVSFPVHINHSYFGSISMCCNEYPDTEGLRDLFNTLIRAIHPVCTRQWTANATFNLPSYFFFTKLIEHEEMSDAYLEAQLEMAGLLGKRRFKLILMDVDEGVEPDKALAVTRAASSINEGRIVCFPYHGQIVAFLYAEEADGELNHAITLKELNERICEPYGIECGMSSLFSNITNLDLAYQQARIALGYKSVILSELFAGESGQQHTNIYLFEEAVLYYLVDPHGKDSRFINSIFDVTIPSILYEEDLKNGTNHVALLWFWLKDERNATSVSRRMHMHRNTVLYHIDKIEKRFSFSMDKKTVRDWLLLTFKSFFLTLNDASLAKILKEEDEEKRREDGLR